MVATHIPGNAGCRRVGLIVGVDIEAGGPTSSIRGSVASRSSGIEFFERGRSCFYSSAREESEKSDDRDWKELHLEKGVSMNERRVERSVGE